MERDFFTAALHADDALADLPDVAPAIRPSTTFEYAQDGRSYRRMSDETTERLEAVLGALEGGTAAVYPSGMAAVAAVLRHIRPRRVSLPDEVYHGVTDFVTAEAGLGMWTLVAPDELQAGDVWWLETPSNPRCYITDLAEATATAAGRGVVTVVDATFATPVLQDTLGLGADFVVHATTKSIAGHSDALGGVVVASDETETTDLREERARDGAVPGALESWLTLRGVRTLPLRVSRQSDTAMQVATFLESSGVKVWYPGLKSHSGYDIATRQMRKFGGMLSFEVEDSEHAAAVVDGLQVFRSATSLGGIESLAELRFRSNPEEPPGLIRLSMGLESPEALIADLDRAFRAVQ